VRIIVGAGPGTIVGGRDDELGVGVTGGAPGGTRVIGGTGCCVAPTAGVAGVVVFPLVPVTGVAIGGAATAAPPPAGCAG